MWSLRSLRLCGSKAFSVRESFKEAPWHSLYDEAPDGDPDWEGQGARDVGHEHHRADSLFVAAVGSNLENQPHRRCGRSFDDKKLGKQGVGWRGAAPRGAPEPRSVVGRRT